MSSRIITGAVEDVLPTLPAASVHCCVTSPPYFGLRDYGGAGQIGLEDTPTAYVDRLVGVFHEVRRVLHDDGTLWLNLGDIYTGSFKGAWKNKNGGQKETIVPDPESPRCRMPNRFPGLKPKDLVGIPWRVAFALQADGWYLRQDIIWHKPNPMPESVQDRCTKAHEYLFLLSKQPKYYFDSEAMKEPAVGALAGNVRPAKGAQAYADGATEHRTKAGLHAWAEKQRSRRDSFKRDNSKRAQTIPGQAVGTHRPDRVENEYPLETRNRRSVWTIATKSFSGAHFAVFPPALVEPCILAGCPAGGVVLDPFTGSGTTGVVCAQRGRRFIGVELNPEYAEMARQRIAPEIMKSANPELYEALYG